MEVKQDRPRDRDLGRLARHLSRENALSLASKLKLPQGNLEADEANAKWEGDPSMQRFLLLRRWKQIFPEDSVGALLKTLSEQKNYDECDLQNVIEDKVCHTDSFGKK